MKIKEKPQPQCYAIYSFSFNIDILFTTSKIFL